jgi:predicted  nucleic acid-binding Zn-ribbon protein
MTTTLRKLILRGCNHCGGDLFPDEDAYLCLQCGHEADPQIWAQAAEPHAPSRDPAVAAGAQEAAATHRVAA